MPRVSTAQEVFDAMPRHFLPDQAGDLNATIQFDLSGEGGGQWYATIANRSLSVRSGQAPQANLSLSMSAKDYVAMINGELRPMQAYMQGKVKTKGDLPLLMKMQKLFSTT
jgi:putative sterol carrier protein